MFKFSDSLIKLIAMRRILSLIVISLLSTIIFAQEAQEQKKEKKAHIEFTETVYDFGEIAYGHNAYTRVRVFYKAGFIKTSCFMPAD